MGSSFTIIVVVHDVMLLQSSIAVQVIVEVPLLNIPEASSPDPDLIVAPVISYVISTLLQLSVALAGGITKLLEGDSQKVKSAGQVSSGGVMS